MDDSLLNRYSRHIMLDDIGFGGQEALTKAQVLVVGAGGLGSPAAMYLAAAGVGTLTICDDDIVDLTNLQRQILHNTSDIGTAKTESAHQRLTRLNPHCRVRPLQTRVNADNADEIIAAADIVVDGSDNYATRHLINRTCFRHGKPLVFGAAIAFDGQAAVFDPRRADSPCYNCLFSEKDNAPDVRCALLGVLAPLVGVIGSIQAMEAIRLIAMPKSTGLVGRLLLLDARDMRWRDIGVPRDPACDVCRIRNHENEEKNAPHHANQ